MSYRYDLFSDLLHHYACFPCRYAVRYPEHFNAPCPRCGGPLRNMGRDFKAPRRSQAAQWRKVQLIADQHPGNRVFESGCECSACFRARRPPMHTSSDARNYYKLRRTHKQQAAGKR